MSDSRRPSRPGGPSAGIVAPRSRVVRTMLGWPTAANAPASESRKLSTDPAEPRTDSSEPRTDASGPRTDASEPRTDASESRTADTAGRERGLLGPLRWLLAIVVLLTACDGKQGIVLWHAYNGTERDALAATAAKWNAEHPDRTVDLVAVPFGAFADKLTSAIPGGNGPDLFIYPQDRIGDWADSGVIEPIEFWVDDTKAARFTTESLESMAYRGSLYGLPLAVKSLALYYRTDLVATPPATTEALLAFAPQMKARDGYALAYANVDLYGHAPWLFGHGGKIMDDAGQLAIATPEAAAAMAFARQLVVQGVTPPQAEGPLVATLFNTGKAAMAISGPWFVADIAAGVPWKVAPLPVVSSTGLPASPFLGAEGILMSARAHDKEAAFAVLEALTSDAAAIERAKIARQVVPNPHAYADPAIAGDEVLGAFRAQLEHTIPMPKGPAMRMVWTPYKTALGEVLAGRAQPADQLRSVEREIAGYLSGPPR